MYVWFLFKHDKTLKIKMSYIAYE